MRFIKCRFLDYLFVLSVATLNNSGSHLLLFPERTTLCGERKEQHQSECTKTQERWCGSWLLTGQTFSVNTTWSNSGPGTSWRCLCFNSHREQTFKMHLYTKWATKQNLWATFLGCALWVLLWHSRCAMAWHALPIQCLLSKHQQENVRSVGKVMTETVYLSLGWVLSTFWLVTNYILSHTPIKKDTGHLGHIPCISWILSGRVWQLHRVLSAHDQTELTVQTHFLPSRWWMHSEIQTSLLPREGWVSQKLFHWLVSLQGSSWCSKKGSGVHYTDFWNTNHSRNYWLTKHLGWHHK